MAINCFCRTQWHVLGENSDRTVYRFACNVVGDYISDVGWSLTVCTTIVAFGYLGFQVSHEGGYSNSL